MLSKYLQIATLTLTAAMASCSKSSKKSNDETGPGHREAPASGANLDAAGASTALVGTWNGDCKKFEQAESDGARSLKVSYTFAADGQAQEHDWAYTDDSCTKQHMHITYTYHYKVGAALDGNDGVFALDLKDTRLTAELLDDTQGVKNACGSDDLKPHTAVQCDSGALFQIFKVDASRLLLGDDPGPSESKRATTLDKESPFKKA